MDSPFSCLYHLSQTPTKCGANGGFKSQRISMDSGILSRRFCAVTEGLLQFTSNTTELLPLSDLRSCRCPRLATNRRKALKKLSLVIKGHEQDDNRELPGS